jgi:enoyl-CoA hydratase/carnithine racemase
VVAAIRGRCLSVGLELALAADVRLADPSGRFGLPDVVEAGRLPCWGGTQRLPRAVGVARATALVLLGEILTANEARRAGLLAGVAAAGDLDEAVDATVEQLLGVGPLALELAKEAVHRGAELPLRDGLRLEGDLNHLLQATDDRAEGLAAFFAKRPPDFAGR